MKKQITTLTSDNNKNKSLSQTATQRVFAVTVEKSGKNIVFSDCCSFSCHPMYGEDLSKKNPQIAMQNPHFLS